MSQMAPHADGYTAQMRGHIRTEPDAGNEEATVPLESIGRPGREART